MNIWSHRLISGHTTPPGEATEGDGAEEQREEGVRGRRRAGVGVQPLLVEEPQEEAGKDIPYAAKHIPYVKGCPLCCQ